MSKEPHVVVIGAINVDVKGQPHQALKPHTSNPGLISISPGGVGRNIAENLSRLNVKTTLMSAISTDPFAGFVKSGLSKAGVDFSNIIETERYPSGLFVALLDHRGDLVNAISDMSILSAITPVFLMGREDIIKTADYVIMDADIPADSVNYVLDLCKSVSIPTCIEPVSVDKAAMMLPYLDRVTMVTPNREEAEVLAGMHIEGAAGVVNAGDEILKKGTEMVIITLGAEGVYVATKSFKRFVSSISTVVEDSVGAGDALISGLIFGLTRGQDMYEATRTGIACATLTLTTRKAVHPDLSPEIIEEIKKRERW